MGKTLTPQYYVEYLRPDLYDKYWPMISAELDRVPHIWQEDYTKEYLQNIHEHRELHAWGCGTATAIKMVVYGRFVTTPRGAGMILGPAFGNDLENCLAIGLAAIEKLGNDMGCSYCDVIGRPGWERVLPGFKRKAVVLTRSLTPFKVN